VNQENSVMLVGNFLSGSGLYENVNAGLARRLTQGGWSVQTTSQKRSKMLRLLDMVSSVWRNRRSYRVAQVDVFSGPAFMWGEAACWALRRALKPYVLCLRGGNLPNLAQRHPQRMRRMLGNAAAVTTPSRYLQQELSSFRSDIQVVPNPLDVGSYQFQPREDPQPRLVWLRAFDQIYNPTMAVRVVEKLVNQFPKTSLLMVGPDKGDGSFQETQSLVRQLGVADRVSFPGVVPKADVPNWLNRGDIFLNTTNIDNTPVSVLEAMACGLCVVSTDVGGIPYLLNDGQDALLVPRNDVDAMAAAVHRILTERELGKNLSQLGRAHVEPFDWSIVLPQWQELLQTAASSSA
jgi:glycosyltransferase involved in cell wall biosynthesis